MKFLLILGLWVSAIGCGVKGDPLPPEEPAYLGRGEPNFRGAVRKLDLRTEELPDEVDLEGDKDEEESN